MVYVMAYSGALLKMKDTPRGIIDLEFAYDRLKVQLVTEAWKSATHIKTAIANTLFDFIFLFFYSLLFYLSFKRISLRFSGFLQTTGKLVAWGAIAAGIFDVLENIGILLSLNDYSGNCIPILTCCFSLAKWLLAGVALLYILLPGPLCLLKISKGNV